MSSLNRIGLSWFILGLVYLAVNRITESASTGAWVYLYFGMTVLGFIVFVWEWE
jgi:hypothetical protein